MSKLKTLDSVILHVPHAFDTPIPMLVNQIDDSVQYVRNTLELTDWHTDKIFRVPGVLMVAFPYSRLQCDVERLPDEEEQMFKVGRGFHYSHGFDGKKLREVNEQTKAFIYKNIYLTHHNRLTRLTQENLNTYGECTIIDCHSFNKKPLGANVEKAKSPDICIGVDEFHTPLWLQHHLEESFKKLGYTVEINNPYTGCIIPREFYQKDKRVIGVMIEINKRLYLDSEYKQINIEGLNTEITDIIKSL